MSDTCDLSEPRTIRIVGAGGTGMSAIATVLHGQGHTVSGSDLKESAVLDRLRATGIAVREGSDPAAAVAADYLARSTAVPDNDPEVVAAREAGVPVVSRAAVLSALTRTCDTIAVAGTHGKTTTSSMLASVLTSMGRSPSSVIGGTVHEIGGGGVWADGDLFVVEADESDGTFLTLDRVGAIITNIEPDHLAHHGSWEALKEAFGRFAEETTGPLVICGDQPETLAVASEHPSAITYGTAGDNAVRLQPSDAVGPGHAWRLTRDGEPWVSFELPIPGRHNALNATAALVLATEFGVDAADAAEALGDFGGVRRRFEFRGEAAGVTFVDDYAHLPTEVAAAIEAATSGQWDRVVCVFQPHRFSRTAEVGDGFGPSFDGADLVVVTDIYPAGEAPRPGVTGRSVARSVIELGSVDRVEYVAQRSELASWLARELKPGDLCLTLGAGDLTVVPDEVLEALRTDQ